MTRSKQQITRTVLITGASAGIGRAAAEAFANRGWNVSATMRAPEASEPFRAAGGPIISPRLDVTDRESIAGAVLATLDRFGGIDAIVNNAGYMLMGPLEAWDDGALEGQFRTNLFGLVELTRAVLPTMRRQGGGTIVNVSSIGGRFGLPLGAAYHASKFAVEGLSESLRFELEPFGIRVKLVEPGGIKTDFVRRGLRWVEHPEYAKIAEPMRRIMDQVDVYAPGPEPVARVIVRAASDRSRRLRYPARPGPFLLAHRVLPDSLWRAVVNAVLASQRRGKPA